MRSGRKVKVQHIKTRVRVISGRECRLSRSPEVGKGRSPMRKQD